MEGEPMSGIQTLQLLCLGDHTQTSTPLISATAYCDDFQIHL